MRVPMNKLLQVWRRLLFQLRRGEFDRDLQEEMRFHLEMKMEANIAAGMKPAAARYAAQRQFGNQTLLQEVIREMWGLFRLKRFCRTCDMACACYDEVPASR